MNLNKKLAVAVSGAVLLMAGQFALADSTTDIVDALVSKGVLTEEEGKLISKGAKSKSEADAKANKARVSVGSFIDNATMYGDIRARYERRDGKGNATTNTTNIDTAEANRTRFKTTLGINTKSGNWYSDWAMSISSKGTSDNVTFGDTSVAAGTGMNAKTSSALYIKRAQIGYNVTDWLSIEAGRMANPLYSVNAMVFDRDIVFEGLQQKLKYKFGDVEVFANAGEWLTGGNYSDITGTTVAKTNGTGLFATQVGLKTPLMGKASFKGAISYYDYFGTRTGYGVFSPYLASSTNTKRIQTATTAEGNSLAVNNLSILDIPAEINFKVSDALGMKVYGEYANNLDGNQRASRACTEATTNVCGLGNDHDAWLIGFTLSSAKDLASVESGKGKEGDWSANLWYQSVGAYALDPSAVDSDIFDGRVNMEGTSFKGQYLFQDNVAFNFTGAWGQSKNRLLGAGGSGGDLALNLRDYTLYQFDVTYKF